MPAEEPNSQARGQRIEEQLIEGETKKLPELP
jgi:hypothetical protein